MSDRIEQIKPVRSPRERQGQRGNAEQTSRFAMSQALACVSSYVHAVRVACRVQVQEVRQNRAVLSGRLMCVVALLTCQRGRVLQFGQAAQFDQCAIEKRGAVAVQCAIARLVRCVRNEQIGRLLACRETSITTLSLGTACQRVLAIGHWVVRVHLGRIGAKGGRSRRRCARCCRAQRGRRCRIVEQNGRIGRFQRERSVGR